jgi:RNA polymerase sigma-32 factor
MNKTYLDNEQLLAEWSKSKSEAIKNQIVCANLKLVHKIAKQFFVYDSNDYVNDLFQEGSIGLIKAIEKFDSSFGVPFGHYAARWIRAYMFEYVLSQWSIIKITKNARDKKLFWKLFKLKSKLQSIDIDKIAKELSIPVNYALSFQERVELRFIDIHQKFRKDEQSHSIEEMLNTEKEFKEPLDPDGDPAHQYLRAEYLKTLFQKLGDFEKNLPSAHKIVFQKRLLADEPSTFEEIGKQINVTKQRVKQIEIILLSKLKSFLKRENII